MKTQSFPPHHLQDRQGLHQSLQPLTPNHPTLVPTRPSLLGRTISTPPMSPVSPTSIRQQSLAENMKLPLTPAPTLPLTPPTSPRQVKSSTNLADVLGGSFGQLEPPPRRSEDSLRGALECPFEVDIVRDHNGREQQFGQGAWSTVYRAVARERRPSMTAGLITPPSSPLNRIPLIVAVKKPACRSAKPVLQNEALVLSHLATTIGAAEFVIPFFGFISTTSSLVLGAVPLSLHEHIESCAIQAKQHFSTWTMEEPVLGTMRTWLDLAERTITALDWLHNEAGVVHGDVKPGNILLALSNNADAVFAYKPLLADFSSSQLLHSDRQATNTLSAVTREYTAPELLSSEVLSEPNATATTASDVFSLAVTLTVAATGELTVYPGSMWQRQAMATQGWDVLNMVRCGEQGTRVPSHGIVDRVLERAVLKADLGRIDAQSWVELVEEIKIGEPTKKKS